MQYFGEPAGGVKIEMMSKNLQRYYTLKCLIRNLLSNVLILIFHAVGGMGRVRYLYSFRALFVLYEAVLDNNNNE